MARAKYEEIYADLKEKIETGEYRQSDILPSEYQLIEQYSCSRNTVRRAIALLAAQGYVQSKQGVGVRVIYQKPAHTTFTVGGIESFAESAKRNEKQFRTDVLRYEEIICDEELSARTGFAVGTKLLYLLRLRYLDNEPLILDHNYFDVSKVPGITREIALNSVYKYIEQDLNVRISTSKRLLTVEHTTRQDREHIAMGTYDCVALITGQVYDDHGEQIEYTQSRHHPDYFYFQDVATRQPVA
ncbi:MAG: UTRA domain-containing protein [Corynebacterium sp.]|nr:UTRA domain-containing protein [Corynebacterium sp.]